MYIKLIVFNIFLTISIPLISQFQLNGSASIINCKCYQLNPDINSDPMVYWGFTASNGGASNFHRFCIDVPDLTIYTSNLFMESKNVTNKMEVLMD